jgi:RNA polymerase-binding transcription factor DksA
MKAKHTVIPPKWAWHYRELRRRREALLSESSERTAESRETFERGGLDEMEIARERSERDTLVAEISQEEAELAEVEAALGRIREGTYGLCEMTREPIPVERLRAVPWTRFSYAAAGDLEARHWHP